MEATRFLPAANPAEALGNVVSDHYLALAISITIYSLCGLCLVVFAVLTFTRRQSSHRQRAPAR
jgi:hypothetical protein